MQVDTAIVKSIINEERSTQIPLYESYGPNTNLLHSEVVIAKGGYVTGIVPPELEIAKTTTMTREDWMAAHKARSCVKPTNYTNQVQNPRP